MNMLRAAFVEQATFGDFLTDGDFVAFPWQATGTHKGAFAGVAPTGKQVTLNGINIERFRDGKVVEHWSQFDTVGLLRQMGALPPPQKPG
jgi:predicted ester cyclase